MIELQGKYNKATVYTDNIDEATISQIIELCNQEFIKDSNIKVMPDCHAGKGCVIGTTMTIKDKIVPNLVGVDIGCLDKDTEFLTQCGWKKISEYQDGDKVLQYNKENDIANFVNPIHYIVKKCDEFIHFKNDKGLDQMLSDEHKVLVWKGYKGKGYNLKDFRADEIVDLGNKLNKGYYGIKTSFNIESSGIDITENEIKLDVMISADGCIKYEKGNKYQIYLHLKKERKINRAKELLKTEGIEYKETLGKDGSTHIYFFIDKKFNKNLSKYWMANKEQLKILSEESLLWDGHSGYRSYFSSTDKDNIDLIQFAFTATNVRAGISVVNYKNKEWKESYIVTPTKNNVIGLTNTVSKVKSIDGKKYCFTVPSGYFVARRNEKIFITGNCGMYAVRLGKISLDFDKLDKFIRQNIPHGFNINEHPQTDFKDEITNLKCFRDIPKSAREFNRALGSLGGGNHFIEVATESNGCKWLVIHSGSRNLGHQVASYYQKRAYDYHNGLNEEYEKEKQELIKSYKEQGKRKEIKDALSKLKEKYKKESKMSKDLCYLEGQLMQDYLNDMRIIQKYASLNREVIGKRIVEECLDLKLNSISKFETIHNYIDLDNMILRKGSISAQKGELVLIPINMRDGSIIAVGKGNPDWNCSAPHGAGRIMSRSQAKENVNLEEFKETMSNVWSTSVNKNTLDEAPMVYKPITEIINNIQNTVEIKEIIKPLYNFKSN